MKKLSALGITLLCGLMASAQLTKFPCEYSYLEFHYKEETKECRFWNPDNFEASTPWFQVSCNHIFKTLLLDDQCYLKEDMYFPCKVDEKWGMMNMKGEIGLDFKYDGIESFRNHQFLLSKNNWFFHKAGKKKKIKGVNDIVGTIDAYAIAKSDQAYVFIDSTGSVHSEIDIDQPHIPLTVECFKHGILLSNGQVAIPTVYDFLVPMDNGDYVANKGAMWGIINSRNEVITPFQYESIDFYREDGFIKCYNNGLVGLINDKGFEICPPIYDDILTSETLSRVTKDGRIGFINRHGNLVIPLNYEDGGTFKNGRAFVKKDGLFGYIDEEGNTVIDFLYDEAKYFHVYDFAKVKDSSGCHLIDRWGKLIGVCE